jgi:predicted RNase H-like HicB family nuclease
VSRDPDGAQSVPAASYPEGNPAAGPDRCLDVYLEIGAKKVFASVADWPGWCRAGKTEEAALDALGAYRDRYAPVAAAAGLTLPTAPEFRVVERLPGNATTDFGAPAAIAERERTSVAPPPFAALVAAAWQIFDAVTSAAPAELRKGPRGGGRDRDKIVDHVIGADIQYARALGLRGVRSPPDDPGAAEAVLREFRDRVVEALRGEAVPGAKWPPAYGARRIAWHALDHAWEVQDRS